MDSGTTLENSRSLLLGGALAGVILVLVTTISANFLFGHPATRLINILITSLDLYPWLHVGLIIGLGIGSVIVSNPKWRKFLLGAFVSTIILEGIALLIMAWGYSVWLCC